MSEDELKEKLKDPAFRRAFSGILEEVIALADYPSDEEMEEIARLGLENPLPEEDRRRLYGKIHVSFVRHGLTNKSFDEWYEEFQK